LAAVRIQLEYEVMLKLICFVAAYVSIDVLSRGAMALSNFASLTAAWKASGITLWQIGIDILIAAACYWVLWISAKHTKSLRARLVAPALVASVLLGSLWFGEMISQMFWGYVSLTFAAFFATNYLVLLSWAKLSDSKPWPS
jgi:hypothetical protein